MTRKGRPEAHSDGLVELAVERIGVRGDGIAHYRGAPVFVPFTVPGDRVRARLAAHRHGGREALVIDRLASGSERVAPLRLVPPERRRARLGLVRPRDPRLPVRVGYRERFHHHLVDLRECPVLEPEIFALIGRLR